MRAGGFATSTTNGVTSPGASGSTGARCALGAAVIAAAPRRTNATAPTSSSAARIVNATAKRRRRRGVIGRTCRRRR